MNESISSTFWAKDKAKWDLKKFNSIFKSRDRKRCAPLAPAHGLYLEKVTY